MKYNLASICQEIFSRLLIKKIYLPYDIKQGIYFILEGVVVCLFVFILKEVKLQFTQGSIFAFYSDRYECSCIKHGT